MGTDLSQYKRADEKLLNKKASKIPKKTGRKIQGKEGRKIQIGILLTQTEADVLNRKHQESGTPLSEIIRRALKKADFFEESETTKIGREKC